MGITYLDAGVDQARKDEGIDKLLRAMRKTHDPGVMDVPWGFAGLYSLKNSTLFDRNYKHPVLVACTDGVGTKLRVASMAGKHDTVGIDLVAMSVNDLVCTGAVPLFFLDYIATGRYDEATFRAVTKGIIDGCTISGCALLGGETAEMPGMYGNGDYDLAGFAVGIVEKSRIVDGSAVKPGDDLIGLASSGLHSNGYSLARKICFDAHGLDIHRKVPELGRTVAEALLEPTRIYAKPVREVLRRYKVKKNVKAIANVTGGGIVENLPRVLPEGCALEIREGSWDVPPVFPWLQRLGDVPDAEMRKVFNLGVGLAMIVSPASTNAVIRTLRRRGEKAWAIGKVVKGDREVRFVPKG